VVPVRIAILGTRGVPPAYGGFETFAAELGTRLVQRGHDVTVYCRRTSAGAHSSAPALPSKAAGALPLAPAAASGETHAVHGEQWNGIDRIVLPAVGHKYLETVSHSFLSAVDALRRNFDVILVCNAANAFVLPLLRAARIPVAINVDGIERRRRKWNVLGRAVYACGEAFSAAFASAVVADANVIASYYRTTYGLDPVTIPYGAEFPLEDDNDVLQRVGVAPREYILYVSRFEPENNPLEVVLAYENLVALSSSRAQRGINDGDAPRQNLSAADPSISRFAWNELKLVMLGAGLYAPELVRELRRHASARILFPGALYGLDYRTLQRNSLVYVQATEVGGTHPALIEAMASGGCVLANDTPENREVGGDAIGYFQLRPDETLSVELSRLLADPARIDVLREAGRRRARQRFAWERVVDSYEALFEVLTGQRARH
jgi:glycosyltransferase involved in cell wall biosynthesis